MKIEKKEEMKTQHFIKLVCRQCHIQLFYTSIKEQESGRFLHLITFSSRTTTLLVMRTLFFPPFCYIDLRVLGFFCFLFLFFPFSTGITDFLSSFSKLQHFLSIYLSSKWFSICPFLSGTSTTALFKVPFLTWTALKAPNGSA